MESPSHSLSVLVGLNGFSYCVKDSTRKVILLNGQYFDFELTPSQLLAKISNIFAENPQLNQKFQAVQLVYQNNLYTVVPSALFQNDALQHYLKYSVRILQNDFIVYDFLEKEQLNLVYIPYMNINNYFFDQFGSFSYRHASTILIQYVLKQDSATRPVVLVHSNATFFDLVIAKDGNLLLANTFLYTTKEDFLYYVLFSAEQLGLKPTAFVLQFAGSISKRSACYQIASKYVQHIVFVDEIPNKAGSQTIRNTDKKKIQDTKQPSDRLQHFILLNSD